MQFKRTKSRCRECPLEQCKRVWSEYNVEKPKIAFIGEAPGGQEEEQGKPFVGPSGSLVQQAAAKAGIIWHTTYRLNAICCRPPDNNIDSIEGQHALECCKPGLDEELAFLGKLGIRVFGILGSTAMHILGVEGSITKQRGSVSVLGKDKLLGVPTFHPSYIMRGNWKEEVTWINDLVKVRDLSLKKWSPPREDFNLFPKVSDVESFVKEALAKKALVACDLETTSLSPFYSKILMVGLAMDGERALVVPFCKQGGIEYWKAMERKKVETLLRKLFAEGRMMFQNAMFDTWHLQRHGFPVKTVAEDTMLKHHAIHPELPHNLGYIVSVYGQTPYWKEVVLGSESRMVNMEDKVIRTYNARDTVVLHQVNKPLDADLDEGGTRKTYENWSLRLIEPLRDMSDTGILVDHGRMKAKAQRFKMLATRYENEMRKLLDLPEGFNFASNDCMGLLVHGTRPKSEKKVLEELAEYDKDRKRRRDTKKFKELEGKKALYEDTRSLYRTTARIRRTESGALTVDDEALLQIKRAALSRLEAMQGLVRKNDSHKKEEQEIRKLLSFLSLYSKYAVNAKLASTFTGFPVMSDGRVHPSFKIHGTATGRLSSSDPNGQNIPGEVQDIFIASPGMMLLKADYSNIELRVLAYVADEPELIKAFESGKNIHDVNTMLLFGIDKKHPQWKEIRRAAKIYVFGRSYGGTVEGIYGQILSEVPELEISFAHFKECDRKYFEKLSKYNEWCEREKKKARETRVSETAFGRKRILLGLPDEIERQALNTPIQGTAGEICELAIIELHEAFKKRKELEARMVLTVHDSILVECKKGKERETALLMKKTMEMEVKLGRHKVRIPVDIGVGSDWAATDMDDAKMELGK